ncbi:cysteine peptidase family C39 domain-containing protein [Erwinia amylovora]|uniref:cysteine peptidase family C39 domain-containing protein n=1 Tax=Erwinia amylovora TaxID=552 RepID=UPI001F045D2A|nr:cysteine peptidase family C39 domain-containing protein [Erwinia amylovora]
MIEIKPAYSFVDLSLIAKKFNVTTSGVKITPQQLQQIHSPTILYINRLGHGHFVILKGSIIRGYKLKTRLLAG